MGKKKIYVSSSVYNLAGDVDERPNLLKAAVVGAIISDSESVSKTMLNSFITGRGIKLRQFANWVDVHGYSDVVGLSTGDISGGDSIDLNILQTQIPPTLGTIVQVQSAEIGIADYSFWASQYVSENYPQFLGTEYVSDMDDATNQITVTFVDESFATFSAINFDAGSLYLYATYIEITGGVVSPVDTGATVILGSGDLFPSITGWSTESNSVVPHTETLTTQITVDVTYSNATPPTHTVTSSLTYENYDERHSVYKQTIDIPSPPGSFGIKNEISLMYQDIVGTIIQETVTTTLVENIGAGVTRTTVTTTITDVLVVERTYRIDTQEILYGTWSNPKIFIYKKGDGNFTLDSMFNASSDFGKFYPFIPFRVNNYDVKDNWPDDLYKESKKAFKKATGGKYDDVRENIIDPTKNPSIGEMDYVYAVFGTALNTKENSAKKYIYNFFQTLLENNNAKGLLDFEAWQTQWNAADASWTAWVAWQAGGYREDAQPVRLPYPPLPTNALTIGSTNVIMNYNVTLRWAYVDQEQGVGLLEPGKKKGDYWITIGPLANYEEQTWSQEEEGGWGSFTPKSTNTDVIYINWQVSSNEWKRLAICGLTYTNMIYAGRSVEITAVEALTVPNTGYEESGFIIPLHQGIYKAMGLIDGNQMATACCYLLFNYYQVVKVKWYQTGLFQVVLLIIIVVIAVFFPPAGGAAGLLGTSLEVGTFLGATGTLAIVIGTIVNYIAAMILINMITEAAIKEFGEKWGGVIGTIASFITLSVGSGMVNGQTFTSSFGSMLRAENLMLLMNSAGNAYAAYLQGSASEVMQEAEQATQEFNKKIGEINQKFQDEFGSNNLLDASQVVDILRSANESSEVFLQRTLMVGSDIADISINMLYDFVNLTTNTDLPKV